MTWLRIVCLAISLMLASTPVGAHAVSASRIDIVLPQTVGPVHVGVDVPLRDLALAIRIDADEDGQVRWGELLDAQAAVEQAIVDGVRLAAAGRVCRWSPEGYALRDYDDGVYVSSDFEVRCENASSLALDYRLFHDTDPRHRAWVTLRDGRRGVATVAGDGPVRFDATLRGDGTVGSYLVEGVRHIFSGYDHLAFLLSLLLPAVLVREAGRWRPEASARKVVLGVLRLATAFTVAHSLTLSAAALGWVTPASQVIEPAIAATVVLSAINNVRGWISARGWMLASGFGLVHGFGFAGALGELGLPRGAEVLALFGFNLGVEAGQLLVVAVALPALLWCRRSDRYANGGMQAASLLIAAVALVWLVQRLVA